MISNAKDKPLSIGTLPNVQGAMLDYFQPLMFTQMIKTMVGFVVVENPISVNFMGVRQPMSPQRISLKPEGQRAWKWETIHAFPDLALNPDDVITFNGVNYRVKEKTDWSEFGYVEFGIIEDYTG